MDAAGKITAEFTIEHSADGIATLIRRSLASSLPNLTQGMSLASAMSQRTGLGPDQQPPLPLIQMREARRELRKLGLGAYR